MIDII
jgi:hypothetical protein